MPALRDDTAEEDEASPEDLQTRRIRVMDIN